MINRVLLAVAVMVAICSTGMAQQGQLQVRAEVRGDLINDVDQSTVAFHPATPYMESSTLLLAEIDLKKLDVEATGKWLRELVGGPEDDPAAEMLRGFIDSLVGAGADRVFATAATRSIIDGGPIVIVPCENPAVVNGLLTVLLQNAPQAPAKKTQVGDKIVLAGSADAVDRVTAVEGVDRPDLILPMKRGSRLDHTAVISLPEEARHDLAALWPDRLPEPSPIQFSPRQMVADVSNIIISLRLPPEPMMTVEIETPDAGAADRVKEVVEKVLVLAGDAKSSVEIDVDVATVKLRASPDTFAKVAMAIASPTRDRASQKQTMTRMRQIGLAIHNYYAKEKHLPPRCFTDKAGTPLLSGRVALLPYIAQMAMYKAMRLDEPWDSEQNRQFSSTLIPTYCIDPSLREKTTIRFPVYPGSLWHGDGPPKDFRDVTDGTSNTIAAIVAPKSAAIQWANPAPWVLSEDDPMTDVFGMRESVTVVLLDGATLELQKADMTNEKLKALLTIAGGETVER